MQGQRIETRLGKTRKERAFLLHIPATVALDASAKWRFIQDNLNVHCSASLVKWIAKREGIKAKDLGNKAPWQNLWLRLGVDRESAEDRKRRVLGGGRGWG